MNRAAAPVAAATGVYLYGFARPGADALVASPTGMSGDTPVAMCRYRDIAAFIDRVPLADWVGPTGETRLSDLRWVGPRAMHHDQVIHALAEQMAVFPANFGVLFSSPVAVEAYMRRHYRRIGDFLDLAGDKDEWTVVGMLDREVAEAAVAARDPRTAKLSGQGGARYLLERKIHQEAQKQVRLLLACERKRILAHLIDASCDHRVLSLRSAADVGRAGEQMLNVAFLVTRSARARFLQRVAALRDDAALATHGIGLQIRGPLPPYRFRPELTEEARELP